MATREAIFSGYDLGHEVVARLSRSQKSLAASDLGPEGTKLYQDLWNKTSGVAEQDLKTQAQKFLHGKKVLVVDASLRRPLISEMSKSTDAQESKKVYFISGYFLASVLSDMENFLRSISESMEVGDGLLLGADGKTVFSDALPQAVVEYQSELLLKLNRNLGASFDVDNFVHETVYDEKKGKLEMHLVSRVPQLVRIANAVCPLRQGESVHTGSFYRYSEEEVCSFVEGLELTDSWTDSDSGFELYYFERPRMGLQALLLWANEWKNTLSPALWKGAQKTKNLGS